jgi:hypothetical protein
MRAKRAYSLKADIPFAFDPEDPDEAPGEVIDRIAELDALLSGSDPVSLEVLCDPGVDGGYCLVVEIAEQVMSAELKEAIEESLTVIGRYAREGRVVEVYEGERETMFSIGPNPEVAIANHFRRRGVEVIGLRH